MLKRILLALLLIVLAGAGALFAIFFYQGRKTPPANSYYVALGSSYAAGAGLGEEVPGSPYLCGRTVNSYPQRLAKLIKPSSFTDMSCGGATVAHVLNGGQFFQGPQIDALGPDTALVTLTAGGNDVMYVGDMGMMAIRNEGGLGSRLMGLLGIGPKSWGARDFPGLQARMDATAREIRKRSPKARIVFVTYPVVLPENGTCPSLGITAAQADQMRPVAEELARVTREAARRSGAMLVDMAVLSRGHDACSKEPWATGFAVEDGPRLHPSMAGTAATAQAIAAALRHASA